MEHFLSKTIQSNIVENFKWKDRLKKFEKYLLNVNFREFDEEKIEKLAKKK